MDDDPADPVQSTLGDTEDLYDVATWDVRTGLDRLAVRVHGALLAARTAAIVLLALGLFLALFGLALPVLADNPLLGGLGLVSILPAVVLVGYLWIGDPTRREPLEAMAVTFLLAVLFATFAALLNEVFRVGFASLPLGMALYFFLVVGPIEEVVKWLAVRIDAYGRPTFDTVVDGVVYGAVAGLGFAAIENLIYITLAFLDASDLSLALQFQTATQTAIGRAFVGPGHVIFSAYAGYYLGLAKFNRGSRGPLVVKGLLIAAALHGLYNTVATYAPFTTVSFVAFVVVFDGILLVLLIRKVRRYEHYYERATHGTGGHGPAAARPEQD
jgi:RsiW-degrading membrane proteinase PrsW (M82 family)